MTAGTFTIEFPLDIKRSLLIATAVGQTAEINMISSGSAIHVAPGGALNLTDVTITGVDGGNNGSPGIQVDSGGYAMLTSCKIHGFGGASYGGGVANDGIMTMVNSSIFSNWAFQCGGGISNTGSMIMMGCSVYNSNANGGGGVCNRNGTMSMTKCSIYSNEAYIPNKQSGGGVWNGATLTMKDCTIFANNAFSGGGIWNVFTGDSQGKITLLTSLIFNNRAATAPAIGNEGSAGIVAFQGPCDDCIYNNTHRSIPSKLEPK